MFIQNSSTKGWIEPSEMLQFKLKDLKRKLKCGQIKQVVTDLQLVGLIPDDPENVSV